MNGILPQWMREDSSNESLPSIPEDFPTAPSNLPATATPRPIPVELLPRKKRVESERSCLRRLLYTALDSALFGALIGCTYGRAPAFVLATVCGFVGIIWEAASRPAPVSSSRQFLRAFAAVLVLTAFVASSPLVVSFLRGN